MIMKTINGAKIQTNTMTGNSTLIGGTLYQAPVKCTVNETEMSDGLKELIEKNKRHREEKGYYLYT
jgi:hypothetical protein